jgi:hypothetical protein
MRNRIRTAALWTAAGVLVVLCARSLAYAVVPSPAARVLGHRAGGPGLLTVALVSLTLGAAVAIAICWLAALGVKERELLERRRLASPAPRFGVGRLLLQTLVLAIGTSLAGGLLEAYIHWRSGLGWHGLHCIVGPVHRNLLPFEVAVSFIAAAVLAAAQHVVAWIRRTFALLRSVPRVRRLAAAVTGVHLFEVPRTILCVSAGAPRAPPARS